MAIERITFLDQIGVKTLSTALLSKTNERISERIVQELTDASDHDHVASAKLLNTLLKTRDELIAANKTSIGNNTTSIAGVNTSVGDLTTKVDDNKTSLETLTTDITELDTLVDSYTHLTINIVTGPIDEVVDPSVEVLYLQRDNEADTTWMLYIYREDGTWVNIGDTGVDLSGYWSKDDNAELAELLNIPEVTSISDDEITAAIEAAFNDTDLFIEYTDFIVTITNKAMVGFKGTENEKLVIPSTFKAEDGTNYKVVGIGEMAFGSCKSLTSITIPNSITNISKDAFGGYTNLTTINVDHTPYAIRNAPWSAYNATINWLRKPKDFIVSADNRAMIGYTGAANEDLVIPSTITGDDGKEYKVVEIYYKAFINCTNLKSVTIPEGVTYIGDFAFNNCTSLSEVTIPNTITDIGNNAFDSCNLKSVTIPESVINVGEEAFTNCTSLTSITIQEGVTTIGYGAFAGCSSLTSIDIPNSVTSIGDGAFASCESLVEIYIPTSITNISSQAFYNCRALTTITLPNTIKTISDYAFNGCRLLESINIPDTVTYIGEKAFSGCDKLTSIDIPESVTNIGAEAFKFCDSLTTINIDNILNGITGAPWGATKATIKWLKS